MMETTEPLTARSSTPAQPASRPLTTRPRFIATALILFVCMNIPFVIYNQLSHVLDKQLKSWFIYHPLFMSIASVGLPLAAVIQQRLLGYTSYKIHMYSMLTTLAFAVAGAYVIITTKISNKEGHFETAHAQMGLLWLCMAVMQVTIGLTAMDPDNRIKFFKPSMGLANLHRFRAMKTLHIHTGRLILVTGYAVVMLGWVKFFGPKTDFSSFAAMGIILLGLCGIVAYDPINDFLNYRKGFLPAATQVHRGG